VKNVIQKVVGVGRLRTLIAMTAQQNHAYAKLVAAWKRREDLRSAGAEVHELGAARIALDEARNDMSRTLRAR
jgi:hypothetical protein